MTNASARQMRQNTSFITSRLLMLAAVCLAVLPLSGCSTAGLNGGPSDTMSVATATSTAPAAGRAKLAFAPIVGAPAAVGDKLSSAVTSAVAKQGIPIAAGPSDTPDYTVRGYLVAAPDKAGTKISYIWDITAKTGERAKRITGEQVVAGKKVKDPWSQVDQSVVDKIAAATSGELSTWVPMKGGAALPAPGATGSTSGPSQGAADGSTTNQGSSFGSTIGSIFGFGGTDSAAAAPVPAAAQPTAPAQAPAQPNAPAMAASGNTASLPAAGQGTTAVPAVTGAPGDGAIALTSAIQRSLANSGVQLVAAGGTGSYTVQGHVTMGAPVAGKQTIKIEWLVFDPAGKKVGTVSQNNSVPQGSLDGTWGKTADMAAAAAATGILKLLPHSSSAG